MAHEYRKIVDAEITKECVIIGNLDHIEIWSKEKWSSYYEGASSTFEEIAEKLMHVFDFQLNVDLLVSFELSGTLAAKRDSLVKFIIKFYYYINKII